MEQKEISKESAVSSTTAHNHTHEYTNNSQISNDTDTHTKRIWVKKLDWQRHKYSKISLFSTNRKNPQLEGDITDHL